MRNTTGSQPRSDLDEFNSSQEEVRAAPGRAQAPQREQQRVATDGNVNEEACVAEQARLLFDRFLSESTEQV